MQARREFGAVVLVGNERVGLKHSFEPLASIASLVADCYKMFKVAADLTFVPGHQNRFDVWEVLVKRRTTYAGLLGNLRGGWGQAGARRQSLPRRVPFTLF